MWLIVLVIALLVLAVRIYYQGQSGVCLSKRRLDGKTAIVTGASAGIGKETARDLARRGARVILACRNVKKAQRVADDIIASTGNGQVYVRQVDLSDLTSVREFAKGVLKSETSLHILLRPYYTSVMPTMVTTDCKEVNNAGMVGATERKLTSDGLELTMSTNHFGHFLLTNMLLGLLKKSAPSRIVVVSSRAHVFCSEMDADDLNYEHRPYPSSMNSYARSKLANILFTKELSDKLLGTGVTVNCLHPGSVTTEIFYKEGDKMINMVTLFLFKLVGKDEVLGSQTTNFLAVSEEVEGISGQYFSDCKISRTSKLARDRGLAKKLWENSEKLVNLCQDDLEFKTNEE